jgi:hypothetical protein
MMLVSVVSAEISGYDHVWFGWSFWRERDFDAFTKEVRRFSISVFLFILPFFFSFFFFSKAKLDAAASVAFSAALQAVWDHEVYAVPPRLIEEMDAVAAGLCAAREVKG